MTMNDPNKTKHICKLHNPHMETFRLLIIEGPTGKGCQISQNNPSDSIIIWPKERVFLENIGSHENLS